MKKIIAVFLILILCLSFVVARAETLVTLVVDSKAVSCTPSPAIVDDRVLIPARAVFEEMGAKVSWNESSKQVKVIYNNTEIKMNVGTKEAYVNGKTVKLDVPPSIISSRTMIPLRFVGESIGADVNWNASTYTVNIVSPEKNVSTGDSSNSEEPPVVIESVSLKKGNGYDTIYITSSGVADVKTMVLSNPLRLVFDIQNATLSCKSGTLDGGNIIDTVRYAPHDNYVRVVVDCSNIPGYSYIEDDGDVQIKFTAKKNNFDYLGGSSSSLIFKDGAKVRLKTQDAKAYSFYIDNGGLSKGTITINDSIINTVEIKSNYINIKLKEENVKYSITGNKILLTSTQKPKNDVITDKTGGIVVLDAGHGGSDPGALGRDKDGKLIANEKDINLAVTLKVYGILKQKGINVSLTRNEDVYVDLVKRADMANDLKATLFVSIHNNSISDPEYKGSMVLYSLTSLGGKALANNILEDICKEAGTLNRGLRNGTNMAVIRHTTMPAVIVECGFLTNDDELNNLRNASFEEKLAKGIADGIIKTLKG
ncbi:MAG: N-acetylmuramoyl-L-alanine amidase family protein [Bacillota bacterium]|nr:N-acetylmuramoyl-L-alanine amidase family protein [Bacillota bacterium]